MTLCHRIADANCFSPVLVNVSSFRLIIGFILSFNVTTWIEQVGFLTNFGLYSAALGAAALALPFIYAYGKKLRAWTSGRLQPTVVRTVEKEDWARGSKRMEADPQWGGENDEKDEKVGYAL
jgi:hypothetical protein